MNLVIILSIVFAVIFAVFTAFSVFFFRKVNESEKKKDELNKKAYGRQKILFRVFVVCAVISLTFLAIFLSLLNPDVLGACLLYGIPILVSLFFIVSLVIYLTKKKALGNSTDEKDMDILRNIKAVFNVALVVFISMAAIVISLTLLMFAFVQNM